MLTMFYAPWCGHCTSMKPDYVIASSALENEAPLTAVDCTLSPDLCKKHGATGYPTLIYFNESEGAGEDYSSSRDSEKIIKFVRRRLAGDMGDEPWSNEPLWGEDNGEVVHLTDGHFEKFASETAKGMLVAFVAPWCGHCKALKPNYAEASRRMEGGFVFAAVDCTDNSKICGHYDVGGYPTIKYFGPGSNVAEEYEGGREVEDLISFAQGKLDVLGNEPEEPRDEL